MNSSDANPAALPATPAGPFHGRHLAEAFRYQRLGSRTQARSAFETALESATTSLRYFDRDGRYHGLERPVIAQQLDRLLRLDRQTEVVLIVQDCRHLQSSARLINLQRLHGERLRMLVVEGRLAEYRRGLVLIDTAVVLRRPDFDQPTTIWDVDESAIASAGQVFNELLEHARPAITSSMTGL